MPINEAQHQIFHDFQHPQKKQILRYIELVYDRESPLNKEPFNDILEHKLRAAYDAGLDPEKDWVQAIIGLEDAEVFALTNYYLTRVQNNREWTLLVTNMELFEEYVGRVRQPIDAQLDEDKQLTAFEKKDKLRNSLPKINQDIEAGLKAIYTKFDDEKNKGRTINVSSPETFVKK